MPDRELPGHVAGPKRFEDLHPPPKVDEARTVTPPLTSLPARAQPGQRGFQVEHQADASNISRAGIVIEGIVFSTGTTVIQWLEPPPMGWIGIYASFEEWMSIHLSQHPENGIRIVWANGEVWEPGDSTSTPAPG